MNVQIPWDKFYVVRISCKMKVVEVLIKKKIWTVQIGVSSEKNNINQTADQNVLRFLLQKERLKKLYLMVKNVVAAIEFFLHNIFVTALVAASAFLTTYNILYTVLFAEALGEDMEFLTSYTVFAEALV